MITYKPGVTINKEGPLKPLLEVLEAMPEIITITSGNDGKHAPNSYHYHDRAIDIRTFDRTLERLEGLVADIAYLAWGKVHNLHVRIEIDRDKKYHYWYQCIWYTIKERKTGEHIHLEVR